MSVAIVDFNSYKTSIPAVLDKIGIKDRLSGESAILLKPNLVTAMPPPVTTPVACCEAILTYLRSFTTAEIVIAEGTGDASRETHEIFNQLGYTKLTTRYGIQLIDLNRAPLRKLENPACVLFPKIFLPEIAFTHFVISVPVLKAHSLAVITGAIKNMMGFAPPKHYGSGSGGWKKAAFHHHIQQALIELAGYRKPDLSILDATIGLHDFHLGGRRCEPPVNKIVAGLDALAVDRKAAELLGLDWKKIPHLYDANNP